MVQYITEAYSLPVFLLFILTCFLFKVLIIKFLYKIYIEVQQFPM
jgi:hypothetical protein